MDTIERLPTDRPPDAAARGLRPVVRRIRGALRHRSTGDSGPPAELLDAIHADLAGREPRAAAWEASVVRGGDPAVIALGVPGFGPSAYVRTARQAAAAAGLARAEAAQTAIRGRTDAGAALVPAIIGSGRTGAVTWLAERALPGEPGQTRMADRVTRARAVAAVARAIGEIHSPGEPRVVGDAEVERWVGARILVVRHALADRPSGAGSWASETERRLDAALRDRPLAVGWSHGDLWLENVRFAGGTDRVTAIVDWDSAAADELALHDLVHLAMTTRRRAERRDFGPVLVACLGEARGAPAPPTLRSLLGGRAAAPAGDQILDEPVGPSHLDPTAILLLAWLRFVEVNIARHPELGRDRRWLDVNVRRVVAWG